MDRLSAESVPETVIFEGWLNVWEVDKESMRTLLSDGKSPKPVWEPHLCVLSMSSRKLSHFRTEKAARDARQNMPVTVEHIGSTKEDFDRRYGYKTVDKNDLLLNSPLASLDAAIERSRTLDSRCSNSGGGGGVSAGGTMPASFDKSSSPPDGHRRGSTSSLNSQEVAKPPSSSQSKFATFFSKKPHQWWRSNLKRTKSATKLDRKKIGNGTNGESENDSKLLPPPFVRSLSLGRLSRRWLARPQVGGGLKGSDAKPRDDPSSEKLRNQKMGKSYSHESLLTSESSLHCIDLSNDGVEVRPLHCSILGLDNCFVVVAGGNGGCKYYGCSSSEERDSWIRHLRHVTEPALEHSYRKENSLEIMIAEAKNLPIKRRYFCEICIDKTVYARTTSKPMQDMLFWGEHFEFTSLPLVDTIMLNLYRESEKKKKKDKHILLAYVNISVSEISSRQMCERWFSASSAIVGKLGKDNRSECASIRLKARYQSIGILPINLYQPLIGYLKSEYRLVVDTLEPLISVKAKEEIAAYMVTSSHCLNCVTSLICDIVMSEFNRSDNVTLALRGNSIATKAVEAYMKLVGQKYLVSTLGELVKMLLDPSLDCEVDPAKVTSVVALKTNQDALVKHCETFWYKIYNSFPSFPIELRRVFSAIRTQCANCSFGGGICDQLVSSCVFLRFFCPAILNPNLFNITQEYPDERGVRNLTLVAKTIQGLANLTGFGGKEEFMTFMNDFVSRELTQMHRFLNCISEVDSNHGLEMQFDGHIDLGKEVAMLHRFLVESVKDMNEASKEKLGILPSVLQEITVAQNHPVSKPSVKKSRLCVNLDSKTPSAAERVASLMTPSTLRRFNPPCTPTTVISPLTPETITPDTHFASSEIKSPVELSFVSSASMSLATTPQSQKSPMFNVSTLPCSPSARRIGGGPRSVHHYQSTDDLLVTVQPEFPSPLREENLSPSVSSLSSRRPDEKQLCKDWEKMKIAADSFCSTNRLKLISFTDGLAEGEGSLDRKLAFRERVINQQKGSNALPMSRSLITADVKDFSRTLPTLQPLAFSNPVYRRSELSVVNSLAARDAAKNSTSVGSVDSLAFEDGAGNRRRRATPPGFRDESTHLKKIPDVCRAKQSFKSTSSESLDGRHGFQQCTQHKGRCLQFTIPISGGGTETRNNNNSFSTTINIPLSKSLDFQTHLSESPALSVRRVSTDSRILAGQESNSNHSSPRPGQYFAPSTLPPKGTRFRQMTPTLRHQTPTTVDNSSVLTDLAESLFCAGDSTPLYSSSTFPQSAVKLRAAPIVRQNCDSAEFTRQMNIVSQTVNETQAMVADAEFRLLGNQGASSPLRSTLSPTLPFATDLINCDNSPKHESSLTKYARGKSQTEPFQLTHSTPPAAKLESLDTDVHNSISTCDATIEASSNAEILPNFNLNNEAVFTFAVNDHGQPFKTTYC